MLSTLPTADVLIKTEGTIHAWSSLAELDLEKKLAVQVIYLSTSLGHPSTHSLSAGALGFPVSC
jgi:hypothetical protein